jgi:hypothetical protein
MARKTADEKREEKARRAKEYTRQFIRDLAGAKTAADLWRLANDGRTSSGDPGDECHHFLGCALHQDPYDGASPELREAIAAAVARVV